MVVPKDLNILLYPHPSLQTPANPVGAIDAEVRRLAARMIELMHEAKGMGLAGPQVGLPWRIFVVNPTAEPGQDRIFINPTISSPSPQTDVREEGCLSIPNVNAQITRPASITIDALDEHGKAFQITSNGLAARVWQHECDHLEGILILDRMIPIDRVASRSALRELERDAKTTAGPVFRSRGSR